ncbi:MAG: DUF3181 family protein [Pegethrix bostrychoides GSE-TBD4-15B]|jgi:hypothetical protein|uniref:DUF3181 family protein n=1 Tax=Pegethrix bostrychoides GSE-TBD4-15B TaxID=2839662 RepID=A0A951P867_9CYAN|nr:DUF3181 family protein [Pegethrix bostrychoides GSE-TBD4-15B]
MSSESVEQLAALIGENVYIDVAKWHLYLRDAKLHIPLAEQIYPMLSDGMPSAAQIEALLKRTPVKLGGGKVELSLADLIPAQAQTGLMEAVAEFQRSL